LDLFWRAAAAGIVKEKGNLVEGDLGEQSCKLPPLMQLSLDGD